MIRNEELKYIISRYLVNLERQERDLKNYSDNLKENLQRVYREEQSFLAETVNKLIVGNKPAHWAERVLTVDNQDFAMIAAGGISVYIDVNIAHTAGSVWSYAGFNPKIRRQPGQKTPWNPHLKKLCLWIGREIEKTATNSDSIYGEVLTYREDYENKRNLNLEYQDQAKRALENCRRASLAYSYYEKGMLPPSHINSRARRFTVKLFLAHYHHVAFYDTFGEEPPKPYLFNPSDAPFDFNIPPEWEPDE